MTDDENLLDRLTGESTRRSVLKSGALATAGAGLGAAGTGGGVAQEGNGGDEGDGLDGDQEWDKGIMPASQFQARSRFIITSPVLQWNPRVEDIRDNVWSEYNTRAIRYLNNNEQILFWQAHEAEIPDYNEQAGYVVDGQGDTGPNNDTPQPEIFRMHSEASLFGDSGYVTVQFTPVGEDEEDDLLDDDDWWYDDDDDDVGLGDDVIDGGNGNATTGGNATGGNATGGGNSTTGGNATSGGNATNGN